MLLRHRRQNGLASGNRGFERRCEPLAAGLELSELAENDEIGFGDLVEDRPAGFARAIGVDMTDFAFGDRVLVDRIPRTGREIDQIAAGADAVALAVMLRNEAVNRAWVWNSFASSMAAISGA